MVKKGKLWKARKPFYEMPNENICSIVVTYNVVIDIFCKKGKLEEARELLYKMPNKNIPLLMSHMLHWVKGCKQRALAIHQERDSRSEL